MTKNLLGLRAENYKRLELVEVTFPAEGGVVAIMGQNAAGKSSLLDALESTIAGRKAGKSVKPIHDDADSARIIATFDDIVVTRVFKANGTTQITVKAADGRAVSRAEELLSALYSHVALDPLAFSRLSDEQQVATLLPLIGVDPAPYDEERRTAFDLRTVKNREVKSLEARIEALPDPVPGLPEERISVAELSEQIQERQAENRAHEAAVTAASRAATRVEELEHMLDEARLALEDAIRERDKRTGYEDPQPLLERLARADEINTGIANRERRAAETEELKSARAEAAALTARIEKAVAAKEKALAEAVMPVPGLSIDDDGNLTLDGIPFSQASTGVKIRTGTAVAMALNPNLRLIVIRDASLLDQGNRDVIDELAKANGFLVLMEIADESSPVGVVIEQGLVREVRPHTSDSTESASTEEK